jgi:LuxR family maltose regulon positive regulatory protein
MNFGKFEPRSVALAPFQTKTIRQLKNCKESVRAVLLEAPPGYGKSLTLETMFRERNELGMNPIWLSLDEADTSLDRLVDLLVTSCERADPEVLSHKDLRGNLKIAPGRLVASMLSSSTGGFEVFIDNLEYCHDPGLGKFLDQLIALSSSGRLWISTSRRIGFDCARHITEGRLIYLTVEDLRFHEADTKGFMQERCKAQLAVSELDQIQARTLGWPVAVSLLATILEDKENPASVIAQFSGRDMSVVSFLRSQFLDRMNKNLQKFLLSVAWFHPVTDELCKYATKDADAVRKIDQLVRENCYLLPLDRNYRRFEFHPMVREFLIHEAERELEPEVMTVVLERALEWARRRGNTAEAVEYALASQNPEAISKVLHEIAPAWVGQKGGLISYIKWVEQAKRTGASITIDSEYWYLWALLFARQHQAAYLQSELLWERSSKDQSLASSPSKSVAFRRRFEELRILIDIFRDQTDEAGKKALKWLEDSTAQNDISIATVACCVAINATASFDFKTAREAIHTAQSGTIAANSDYGNAWVAALSAQIDLYEGEYCHCHETLSNSLQRAMDSLGTDSNVVSTTQLLLASCLLQMGMREEATKQLVPGLMFMPSHGISETTFCGIETAIELWDGTEESPYAPSRLETLIDMYPPPMSFVYRCFLARRLLRMERFEEAILQAELVGIDFRVPPHTSQTPSEFVQELVGLTQLEYLFAKGMNRQAIALAENLLKSAEIHRRRGVAVELEVMLAILAFRSQNLKQALRHTHRAIRLAAKRGILQPFLLRMNTLRSIVLQFKEKDWGFADQDERLLYRKLSGEHSNELKAHAVSPTESEESSPGSLTSRELEFLRLADAGLSNQQIAERSGVALTTVKWHFSNIYSKLEVRSRSAAAAKVRALNLLKLGAS